MIHIKRFIDKVSAVDGRQGKDVVIPIQEARGIKDELTKLLIDRVEQQAKMPAEVIEVQLTGGKF